MAVKIGRTGWMSMFIQMRSPTGFLQRLFTVKPGNIFNGETIILDIQRFGEDVAIVITKCTGPNLNDIDEFTTKEFTPPSYGEAFALDACELLKRTPGVDPYTAAYTEYAGQMVAHMMRGFMKIDEKIIRAIELQASQILQTGKLTLTDNDGDTRFELDFKPKATHFTGVTTTWATVATADPLGDLLRMANIVSADGQVDVDRAIFGEQALKNFLESDKVKSALDNRRMTLGEVAPEMRNSGATFFGHVWAGTYRIEMWAYPRTFKDPVTGAATKYIADDNVIVMSSNTRLDRVSAGIPLLVQPDPRVAGLIPGRLSSAEEGFDVTPNVYASLNGKQIMGELETRTLLVPVQIDGYGVLDTDTAI